MIVNRRTNRRTNRPTDWPKESTIELSTQLKIIRYIFYYCIELVITDERFVIFDNNVFVIWPSKIRNHSLWHRWGFLRKKCEPDYKFTILYTITNRLISTVFALYDWRLSSWFTDGHDSMTFWQGCSIPSQVHSIYTHSCVRRTDNASYRDERMHLKNFSCKSGWFVPIVVPPFAKAIRNHFTKIN